MARRLVSRPCSCGCLFFFQAEDGIRDSSVTGVQTCALPIYRDSNLRPASSASARPPCCLAAIAPRVSCMGSANVETPDRSLPGHQQISKDVLGMSLIFMLDILPDSPCFLWPGFGKAVSSCRHSANHVRRRRDMDKAVLDYCGLRVRTKAPAALGPCFRRLGDTSRQKLARPNARPADSTALSQTARYGEPPTQDGCRIMPRSTPDLRPFGAVGTLVSRPSK